MSNWRNFFQPDIIEQIESLTEEQKQRAAAMYAAKSLEYPAGHKTVEQARAALDTWPVYYFSWLGIEVKG